MKSKNLCGKTIFITINMLSHFSIFINFLYCRVKLNSFTQKLINFLLINPTKKIPIIENKIAKICNIKYVIIRILAFY